MPRNRFYAGKNNCKISLKEMSEQMLQILFILLNALTFIMIINNKILFRFLMEIITKSK